MRSQGGAFPIGIGMFMAGWLLAGFAEANHWPLLVMLGIIVAALLVAAFIADRIRWGPRPPRRSRPSRQDAP